MSQEAFKPKSLTIKELFTNADSKYKIPQYQRPYKWEDEQIERLWDDIYESYENGEENYFLGSIITAKPRDNENSSYLDVVDGQQRLTTLTILLCVIRDMFPNLNKTSEDENAIRPEVINFSIADFGSLQRLKLYTHAQHRSDFENEVQKGNTLTLTKPYKYLIRTDEEPKYKFINTACIFREKLEKLGNEGVEKLVNYLFNKVQIIRIDCSNREFAIKLFQVLNDRGMDLTAADLLKSFLLQKLYDTNSEDPEFSKIQEESFISDWREMEQTIKTSDINLNELFIMYEYYLLGANPKKSLFDELQKKFKGENPTNIIADLKDFALNYYKEIYEMDDKVLYSFQYIRWNMYWKSIILTAIHTDYAYYQELKILLRRFYYLYWIAGKTLSQIKQTSFNIIKWIKDKQDIEFIETELNTKLDSDKIIELVKRYLTSEQVASEPWIKPLLLLMEYNVTDDSKLSFIPLNKDVHLEHILPVKFERFKEWNHITIEESVKWLNSVGNLTLLSGAKNIEASNNPFNVKMEVYKGKGKYNAKKEKITAFLITQQIVHDYENEKFKGQWTKEAIENRWKWFFGELQELLDVDFSEEKAKFHTELR